MMNSCQDMADQLATKLAEKDYDQEIVSMANDLAKAIGEWENENPLDAPVVKTVDNPKYGTEEVEEEVEKEYSKEDMRDMPMDEHKKVLKKKGIMIVLE